MKHRGIRIATQQDVRDLIDRCLAVEEASRSVVEAYRVMRAAGSFSGFWTHIDDLAKALPVDAASSDPAPSHPVAETVVGRGGPVTEAFEVNSQSTSRSVAGDAATPSEPMPNALFNLAHGLTADGRAAPGDAAPDETPRRRCVCSMPGHWGGHDKTQPCGACGGYHPDALKPAAPDETPAPAPALLLADSLAEAAETMAIEIERREIPFDLHPPIRGVIEAAKRYRTARGTR